MTRMSSKKGVTVQCNVESSLNCDGSGSDHLCFVISSPHREHPSSAFYQPNPHFGHSQRGSGVFQEEEEADTYSYQSDSSFCQHRRHRQQQQQYPSRSTAVPADDAVAMREPPPAKGFGIATTAEIQRQQQQQQQQQQVPLTHLSVQQLQDMAQRQQQQIEAQQHMLVAKEQRLKYLRQQDFRHHQMAAEYERLRRLREKVESQELKLRKLRALRGQNSGGGASTPYTSPNAAVLADLESIRRLFNEKEKELSMAVRKVDDLTHQLEDLRTGRVSNGYPPQLVELERLRRELAYRKQLNEQQNNMISQQRSQLSMGQDEMMKIDNRILELQDRLARKRVMNQQLASQITAATSAKQVQLRAIQQGMSKNKNKPVSTVEPFQRQVSPEDQAAAEQEDMHNKINNAGQQHDPKYQTLPFGTKFNMSKSQKIEQLRQEKENNNVQFASDLPQPPPPLPPSALTATGNYNSQYLDHQGNFSVQQQQTNQAEKPMNSVAPSKPLKRPTELFSTSSLDHFISQASGSGGQQQTFFDDGLDSPNRPKPALPPKPLVSKNGTSQQLPPPYIPAPPLDNARSSGIPGNILEALDDSSITIRETQNYHPSNNLSVSAHPEEGTSVDDDGGANGGEESNGHVSKNGLSLNLNSNQNVHISINRRIEMPPAFHFPEDQTPPSDLIGRDFSRDVSDNASMYPMMNQIYKEFDHLSVEEKQQLFAKSLIEEEDYPQTVPDFESDGDDGSVRPPGIIRRTNLKGQESSTCHNRHVCFDPLALLLDASLEGELDLVRRTAGQVPDPSAANDEGITALHNAICAGHFEIVQFLVEFGCDVNAQDSDGWTPLHCAASCNNLPMVRFLVEHGACIFATTFSDQETAAEKCEEDEEGFAGCSEYLYSIQEKLGIMNEGRVYSLYDHAKAIGDELSFEAGDALVVMRKGDEVEKDWWWARHEEDGKEGYIPQNFLGLCPRVNPAAPLSSPPSSGKSGGKSGGSSSSMSEESDSSLSGGLKNDGGVAGGGEPAKEEKNHSSA